MPRHWRGVVLIPRFEKDVSHA